MTLAAIGSGFGRTGTNSLKLALEMLGFSKCHHMSEVFENPDQIPAWRAGGRGEAVDWAALLTGYRATCDWPSAALWRTLAEEFPDAKVIHTERPEEDWWKSYSSTIAKVIADPETPGPDGWHAMAREIIIDGVFGGRFDDRETCLAAYRRNNEAVRAEVDPARLLIFDPRDGWAPLCGFLDVPVPDDPYPRTNSGKEFHERMASIGETRV